MQRPELLFLTGCVPPASLHSVSPHCATWEHQHLRLTFSSHTEARLSLWALGPEEQSGLCCLSLPLSWNPHRGNFLPLFCSFAAVVMKKSDGIWNFVPDQFYLTFRPNSFLSLDFELFSLALNHQGKEALTRTFFLSPFRTHCIINHGYDFRQLHIV